MFCANFYDLGRGGTGVVNDISVLGLFPIENVWKQGENSFTRSILQNTLVLNHGNRLKSILTISIYSQKTYKSKYPVGFRVIAIQRRKMSVFPKSGHFRPKTGHNSKNAQNRYTEVCIFEINIKFRIDWYAGIYILKMFQKFHNQKVVQITVRCTSLAIVTL